MRGCLATAFDVARPGFFSFAGVVSTPNFPHQLASLQGPRRLSSPPSGPLATARHIVSRLHIVHAPAPPLVSLRGSVLRLRLASVAQAGVDTGGALGGDRCGARDQQCSP